MCHAPQEDMGPPAYRRAYPARDFSTLINYLSTLLLHAHRILPSPHNVSTDRDVGSSSESVAICCADCCHAATFSTASARAVNRSLLDSIHPIHHVIKRIYLQDAGSYFHQRLQYVSSTSMMVNFSHTADHLSQQITFRLTLIGRHLILYHDHTTQSLGGLREASAA